MAFTLTLQALIEGYLRPMRAHDWDKGSLYSFRTMSFPAQLPYDAIVPPVLVITGEKDRMLTRSAKQVLACPFIYSQQHHAQMFKAHYQQF